MKSQHDRETQDIFETFVMMMIFNSNLYTHSVASRTLDVDFGKRGW